MGAPATMDVRLLPKTQAVGDYVLGRPNPIINEMTGEGASLFSQNTTARCAEVGPEVFSTANQCPGGGSGKQQEAFRRLCCNFGGQRLVT